MNFTLHTAYSLLKSIFAFPLAVAGMFGCEPTDTSTWLTEAQVIERLTDEGWHVSGVKQTESYWKAIGNSPEGDKVKVHLHPVSGEVLMVNPLADSFFHWDS
ncbi:MAG: PepSY domain-containing protein [Pseudomonadota bacterium]